MSHRVHMARRARDGSGLANSQRRSESIALTGAAFVSATAIIRRVCEEIRLPLRAALIVAYRARPLGRDRGSSSRIERSPGRVPRRSARCPSSGPVHPTPTNAIAAAAPTVTAHNAPIIRRWDGQVMSTSAPSAAQIAARRPASSAINHSQAQDPGAQPGAARQRNEPPPGPR